MKNIKTVAVSLSIIFFLISNGGLSLKAFAKSTNTSGKALNKELLQKHLASIGTAQAREAVKSMTILGTSQAVFKGRGEGRTEGIVVLASQAEKSMIGMKFNNSDYPFEKLAYDGSDFSVGYVRPGEYTVLGGFLRVNEKTFKSGIIGGVLSTAWELQNYDQKIANISSKGTSKIDGVEMLKFEYNRKKGSDLDVTMFFDPVTYRHVRTEYKRIISGGQGLSVDTSSRQNETRYKLVEKFSEFKEENGLTLPHNYDIYLEILTGNGTVSYTWNLELNTFSFNQVLGAAEFRVDGN